MAFLISYAFAAVFSYFLFMKINPAKKNWAFIPFVNVFSWFEAIKISYWNILWLFVPIAGVVFTVIWTVKFFKAFNMNPYFVFFLIVPVIGAVVITVMKFYMVLSKNVKYTWDDKQTQVA